MRYLGIDYGAKRIGIAISDEAASFAFPKETLPNDMSAVDRIASIVKVEHVGEIIMGDARAMNGAENLVTADVESFAAKLEQHIKVPVSFSREAWSSIEAARFAPKGKEHDDSAAAAIILQRYLDTKQRKEHEAEEEMI